MKEQLDEEGMRYFSGARRDMLAFIPENTRLVLEIGCGAGQFSRSIQQKFGAETWGIEPNQQAAALAEQVLHRVLTGTVEEHLKNLPDNFFDCICMNDVIEHIADPWVVLQQLKGKLAKSGVLIASIPNVRHYKNLNNLLMRGDWFYTDSGVLDKTHLRFFTPKSMQRMFAECGYSIIRFQGVRQSRKFFLRVMRWFSFGALWDIAFMQFAIVAAPLSAPETQ